MAKSKEQKAKSIDIRHVAELANLNLTREEQETFAPQLEEVVSYISKLDQVDTRDVEPIGHITGQENVTRADVAKPSMTQDDALANAPKVYNGFFQVEAIFENND